MRLLISVALTSLFQLGNSQMVLLDDTEVPIISYKVRDEEIDVTLADGLKKTYNFKQVRSIWAMHAILVDPIGKGLTKNKYELVTPKFEGTINLYETSYTKFYAYNNNTAYSEHERLFIGKPGKVTEIKFNAKSADARNETMDSLKKLVSDCPESLATLNDLDFDLNYKNVIRVVRNYNLCKFKTGSVANRSQSPVIFYPKKVGQDQNIVVSVNDSVINKIPIKGVLKVDLDSKNQNKVCIEANNLKFCDIIISSAYHHKCFEVDLKGKKSIEIEEKSTRDYAKYLQDVKALKE